MNCQQCGAPFEKGMRFCASCGISAPPADAVVSLCTNCASPIKPSRARFCASCGTPVVPVGVPAARRSDSRAGSLPSVYTEPEPSVKPAENKPDAQASTSAQNSRACDSCRAPQPDASTGDSAGLVPEPAAVQDQVCHNDTPSIRTQGFPQNIDQIPMPRTAPPAAGPQGMGYSVIPQGGDMRGQSPKDLQSGRQKGGGMMIAALAGAVICIGVAVAIIFDLFGFRGILGGIIPGFAQGNFVSPASESGDVSSQANDSDAAQSDLSDPESFAPEHQASADARFKAELEILPRFTEARDFDDYGHARVCDGDVWGIIDRHGDYIVEPAYNYIYGFNDDHALVEASYGEYDVRYGLINRNGDVIIHPEWEDAYSLTEGLIAVCKNDKYGYIDLEGNIAIPFLYDHAYSFESGYALARLNENYFFIDHYGNIVSRYYEDADSFSEGYASVKIDGLWGYVDLSFDVAVPCVYEEAQYFTEGVGIVKKLEKYLFVDGTGAEASPAVDELWNYTNGYAIALDGDYFGLLDIKSHEYIIQPQYYDMYLFAEGLLPVTPDGYVWYYVDLGNMRLKGMEFDEALPFYQGIASVRMGEKYGLIDLDGNLVSEYQWEETGSHSGNMIAVQKDGLWGYLSVNSY